MLFYSDCLWFYSGNDIIFDRIFGFVDIIFFVKCNIEYYGIYNVNIIIKIG